MWRAAPSVWCAAWWSSPTSPTYRRSPSGTETVRLIFNKSIHLFNHSAGCVFCVNSSLRLHSRPTDKLAEMSVGGGAARLTLPHLAKDDEGLYTLRIFTKDGTAEHSAYLFVSGTPLCIMGLFNVDQKWTFKAQNGELIDG